jgi:hypothetical protein
MKKQLLGIVFMLLILSAFNQVLFAEGLDKSKIKDNQALDTELAPNFFSVGILAWNYNVIRGPISVSSLLAGPVINVCVNNIIGMTYIIGK